MMKKLLIVIVLLLLVSPVNAHLSRLNHRKYQNDTGGYLVDFTVSPKYPEPGVKTEVQVKIVSIDSEEIYGEAESIPIRASEINGGTENILEGEALPFMQGIYETQLIFPREGSYIVSAYFTAENEVLDPSAVVMIFPKGTFLKKILSNVLLGILITIAAIFFPLIIKGIKRKR